MQDKMVLQRQSDARLGSQQAHSFWPQQFPQSASQDQIGRKQGKEKEPNSFTYSLRVIIPSKKKPN